MDSLNLNCSVKEYKMLYNLTAWSNSSLLESVTTEPMPIQLGAVYGILVALFMDVFLTAELNTTKSTRRRLLKVFNAKNISRTIVLTVLVLILPVVFLFLILMLVYKVLCAVIIKRKDKRFVSFLDCFDVFWILEDDTSKGIINVLGTIQSDSPVAIANSIKEKLRNIIPNKSNQKIFYRRHEGYGFYYWRKYSFVDIDEYVEIVELPNKTDQLDVADLENLMTEMQDQTLPYADEGLFKILITRQSIGKHKEINKEYGIIFRIHHSVGDGVALIEFLCQSFADNSNNCRVNMFSFPESCNQYSPTNLVEMMQKLLEMPLCFIDNVLRKPDNSVLHGPNLLGKKVFKWTDSDENLLMMVKNIKENFQQFNFSDVLITSLSKGLKDFLSKKIGPVPDEIAVVLPVRFPKSSIADDTILKNDFSLTILDVPLKPNDSIVEINNRCNVLRRSAEPLDCYVHKPAHQVTQYQYKLSYATTQYPYKTNFYFLKLVCSVLPNFALRPLLDSSHATLVFSNLPGPGQLSICGGNVLKSLVFFVPNKGTTGLGVTALCYGGVLRFAAMADAGLVSGPQDLAIIIDGMVDEIKRLYEVYGKK